MRSIDGSSREHIAARAQSDPEFREALLSDPKVALEKLLGASLSAGVTVSVIEDTDEDLHVVIPPPATDELSEEQLSAVAGGVTSTANTQKTAEKELKKMQDYMRG